MEDIAGKLGIGRSQLARKLKALTNYTPVEIVRRIRLQNARRLLNKTDKSIS